MGFCFFWCGVAGGFKGALLKNILPRNYLIATRCAHGGANRVMVVPGTHAEWQLMRAHFNNAVVPAQWPLRASCNNAALFCSLASPNGRHRRTLAEFVLFPIKCPAVPRGPPEIGRLSKSHLTLRLEDEVPRHFGTIIGSRIALWHSTVVGK